MNVQDMQLKTTYLFSVYLDFVVLILVAHTFFPMEISIGWISEHFRQGMDLSLRAVTLPGKREPSKEGIYLIPVAADQENGSFGTFSPKDQLQVRQPYKPNWSVHVHMSFKSDFNTYLATYCCG